MYLIAALKTMPDELTREPKFFQSNQLNVSQQLNDDGAQIFGNGKMKQKWKKLKIMGIFAHHPSLSRSKSFSLQKLQKHMA